MEAGREWDIRPFGLQAQRLLRLEKGHIIVSQDTDFETTPWKVGMQWAVKLDKPDFVGKAALLRGREARRRASCWCRGTMPAGTAAPARGRDRDRRRPARRPRDLGLGLPRRSATRSAWPGLQRAHAAAGTRIVVGGAPATVFAGHAFYDPEGEKLRA